jgi:MFS family permease
MVTGSIASAYFLAQFLTSIPWGSLSDRYGRRPVLLIGLVGNTITMLMFGLSPNLPMAVLSRCLCGALNGNVGVSKSVLGEITDSTNQPMAFAMFGFCWGVGGIGNCSIWRLLKIFSQLVLSWEVF